MKYVLLLLTAHYGWFSSSVDATFEDMSSKQTCETMARAINDADDTLDRKRIHAFCFEK